MTERFTPNDSERLFQSVIDELTPVRDACEDKRERKQLSSRIRTARFLRDFARTRAGYVRNGRRLDGRPIEKGPANERQPLPSTDGGVSAE